MPPSTRNRHAFADALKRGLYEAIFRRRDIRQFLSDPIPDDALARVLIAAHHAASVGFDSSDGGGGYVPGRRELVRG